MKLQVTALTLALSFSFSLSGNVRTSLKEANNFLESNNHEADFLETETKPDRPRCTGWRKLFGRCRRSRNKRSADLASRRKIQFIQRPNSKDFDMKKEFTGARKFKKYYKNRVYEFSKNNADFMSNYQNQKIEKETGTNPGIHFNYEKLTFKNHDKIYTNWTSHETHRREKNSKFNPFSYVDSVFRDSDNKIIAFEKYERIPYTKAEFHGDRRAHLVMDTRVLRLSDAKKRGVKTDLYDFANDNMWGHDCPVQKTFWSKLKSPECRGFFHAVYIIDIKLSDDGNVIQEYNFEECIPNYVDENGKKHECFSTFKDQNTLDYPYTQNKSKECGEKRRNFTRKEIKKCFIDNNWFATKPVWIFNAQESKKLEMLNME